MANEYYSTLRIGPEASEEEIKRAYFKLVRETEGGEKDPDLFKQVRAVYETLSDSSARKHYDQLQRFGGEVERLSNEAEELLRDEDWDGAVSLYKRLLVLEPDLASAWSSLALCYGQQDEWVPAIKALVKATELEPESCSYWTNLGWAYLNSTEDLAENSLSRTKRLTYAQQSFAEAVKLDPQGSGGYRGVAAVRREFDDWDGAATWLQSAVDADGALDVADLDCLCELCFVYFAGEHPVKLKQTADRLVEIAPEDEEARKFVKWRVCHVAGTFAEAGAFKEAALLFERAKRIDPSDAKVAEWAKESRTLAKADAEFEKIKDDDFVVGPIGFLAMVPVFQAHGVDIPDQRFRECRQALDTWPAYRIADSVARIRSTYPTLYDMNREVFDKLRAAVGPGSSQRSSASPSYSPNSSSGSGCFVATAAFGSPLTAELDRLRGFRDEYLLARTWGRCLVRLYYRIGPRVARSLLRTEPARAATRSVLRGLLKLLP